MDPDFTALASRVAARAEVLGCVILSRDGLVLGAFPPHGEQDITPGLLRFASLGDPDRGFAQFSDELWAYVREGSYAAFAVAEKGTRPGILLDYLEQALLVAEEARQFGVAMSEPVQIDLSKKGIGLGRRLRAASPEAPTDFRAAVAAPPREAAHEAGPAPVVPTVDDNELDGALAAAVASAAAGTGQEHADGPDGEFEPPPGEMELPAMHGDVPPEQGPSMDMDAGGDEWRGEEPLVEAPSGEADWAAEPVAQPAPEAPAQDAPAQPVNPEEIDRIALAREFAQLLQEAPGPAEGGN